MTDDTARRERAEKLTEQVASLLHELWSKWFLHQYQNSTNENVRRWMAQAGTTYWGLSESDKDRDRKLAQPIVEMILAGAREEAAEKEKIIRDLSDAMEVGKEIVSRSVALITERDAEITALRERLKDALAQIEGLENELIEVREMSDE